MGTTMTFYLVENRGLDREPLQERMTVFREKVQEKRGERGETFSEYMQHTLNTVPMGEELQEQVRQAINLVKELEKNGGIPAKLDLFSEMAQAGGPKAERKGPALAWREGAKWLPFFEENLCEGYNASSRHGSIQVSKAFGAPVLAFSIFDSDVLFVSYCDPEKNIYMDYAKPNFDEFEEYDDELYKAEFPQFLCAYGDERTLREIWEGEEVFADDRMAKLCEAIGAQVLYDGEDLPEGYERVE